MQQFLLHHGIVERKAEGVDVFCIAVLAAAEHFPIGIRRYFKILFECGMERFGIREVTVNEQNPQARGFYEHMGFHVCQRWELDEQGRPYPILKMQL